MRRGEGASYGTGSHNSLSGRCWPRGAVGAPTCHPLGLGLWGLRGGSSEKKFHTIAHSRHRTYPEAKRDASSLRLQGLGGAGGPPRHSAAATTARGRGCAGPLSAACRPPPNFAQRQHGTASPGGLAQRRGRSFLYGARGARPFSSPSPPLLLLPPPCSQAGQLGGIERPAPSSAAVAAAARTVTLAAFEAIYIHTIGFHS